MVALIIGFLILIAPISFYSAWKCDEIYLPYKTFNVFGKFKAYLFVNFIELAIVAVIVLIGSLFSKNPVDSSNVPFFILMIPLGIAIAMWAYKSAKSDCPDGPLKDDLAKNMFMTGAGYSMRRVLFFMTFIAEELTKPKHAVDSQGREIYIFYDDNVYDKYGHFVGKKTDEGKYVRLKD